MKTQTAKVPLSILSVLLIVLLFSIDAPAGHNSCRIKAVNDDVRLRVFDRDQDGNPIREGFNDGEIWRGVLKNGESKKIKSSFGRINYSFRSLREPRAYGGNFNTCFHGETIRVP